MKIIMLLLWFTLVSSFLYANDGGYTLSGNQLIPIKESEISIKKELLTITLLDNNILDVKVEYTFFNPSKPKEILVGFEASEPEGDVETEPVNGGHPYMKSFSILMNRKKLSYKVKINNQNDSNVGYVYYFRAPFKKGINHITHHYTFEYSGGAGIDYEFDYILSAASRWGKGAIEDFTLIIDVGDFSEFQIVKSFFKKANEWQVDGSTEKCLSDYYNDKPAIQFYVRKSPIIFKKKNFKIKGELFLISERYSRKTSPYAEVFDYKKVKLWFSKMWINDILPKDRVSYKIYKNLPYAQRGYVFKDKDIQNYYEGLSWYKRTPSYKPTKSIVNEELNEMSLNILKNLPYAKRGYSFTKYNFKCYSWYSEKKDYKANFLALPKNEQVWISKIKAMKKSDDIDFYELMDEYEKLYKFKKTSWMVNE